MQLQTEIFCRNLYLEPMTVYLWKILLWFISYFYNHLYIIQKRKLSDMLGPQWSKEELERFYEAYRKYGKDWKKVRSNFSSMMLWPYVKWWTTTLTNPTSNSKYEFILGTTITKN